MAIVKSYGVAALVLNAPEWRHRETSTVVGLIPWKTAVPERDPSTIRCTAGRCDVFGVLDRLADIKNVGGAEARDAGRLSFVVVGVVRIVSDDRGENQFQPKSIFRPSQRLLSPKSPESNGDDQLRCFRSFEQLGSSQVRTNASNAPQDGLCSQGEMSSSLLCWLNILVKDSC
jgi:hypothetical protein